MLGNLWEGECIGVVVYCESFFPRGAESVV